MFCENVQELCIILHHTMETGGEAGLSWKWKATRMWTVTSGEDGNPATALPGVKSNAPGKMRKAPDVFSHILSVHLTSQGNLFEQWVGKLNKTFDLMEVFLVE